MVERIAPKHNVSFVTAFGTSDFAFPVTNVESGIFHNVVLSQELIGEPDLGNAEKCKVTNYEVNLQDSLSILSSCLINYGFN